MNKKKSLLISFFLFILSFSFIGYGFYYDYQYNNQQIISIITNATIKSKPDSISITKNEDIKKYLDLDLTNIDETKLNTLTKEIKDKIKNEYEINIKYGNEIDGYSVGGLTCETLTDEKVIYISLAKIYNALNLYPKNFFKEFGDSGISLEIYIIKEYSMENVTGLTDSTNKNVIISLATDYSLEETIHHELFHYIDYYIMSNGGEYTTWNELNPNGFNYGERDETLVYTKTGSSDSYFVNTYAQENEYEDRASTFEYMMSNIRIPCFKKNTPIYLKSTYMANQIELFFSTVSSSKTEYWERYLKDN